MTIHRIVEQDGGAQVRRLVELLGVSCGTMARDIRYLHERGMVQRVRGGALRAPGSTRSRLAARDAVSALMREVVPGSLATRAREFIKEGAVIALSAGPISTFLAHEAARVSRVTAVTYSLSVVQAFHRFASDDQALVFTGGTVIGWQTMRGAMAASNVRSMQVDVAGLRSGRISRRPHRVESVGRPSAGARG